MCRPIYSKRCANRCERHLLHNRPQSPDACCSSESSTLPASGSAFARRSQICLLFVLADLDCASTTCTITMASRKELKGYCLSKAAHAWSMASDTAIW
eukprot:2417902-Prymnesium_polylepis.3